MISAIDSGGFMVYCTCNVQHVSDDHNLILPEQMLKGAQILAAAEKAQNLFPEKKEAL